MTFVVAIEQNSYDEEGTEPEGEHGLLTERIRSWTQRQNEFLSQGVWTEIQKELRE